MKKIGFAVKIAITAVILYFLFRRINLSETLGIMTGISVLTLILLIITAAIKQVTQFINWNLCLSINEDYRPKASQVLSSMLIGSALRFLLPGGHATYGKVYFLNYSKRKIAVSITMEKFMLTWSVLLFGAAAALTFFEQYSLFLRIAVLAVIALVPLIIHRIKFLLPNFAGHFDKCLKIVPSMTLVQALYVSLTILQYCLIINNFICLPYTSVLVAVPLILTANVIPITYSGLGLRESFSMYVFASFGVSPEIAVAASLTVFMINAVIPALIGIILIFISALKPKNA